MKNHTVQDVFTFCLGYEPELNRTINRGLHPLLFADWLGHTPPKQPCAKNKQQEMQDDSIFSFIVIVSWSGYTDMCFYDVILFTQLVQSGYPALQEMVELPVEMHICIECTIPKCAVPNRTEP